MIRPFLGKRSDACSGKPSAFYVPGQLGGVTQSLRISLSMHPKNPPPVVLTVLFSLDFFFFFFKFHSKSS